MFNLTTSPSSSPSFLEPNSTLNFVIAFLLPCLFPYLFFFTKNDYCYFQDFTEEESDTADTADTDTESPSPSISFLSLLLETKYTCLDTYAHKYKHSFLQRLAAATPTPTPHSSTTAFSVKNRMVMEATPIGNVVLQYDEETRKFIYYSDHVIPYRFLQTVARAYALKFSAFHLFYEDWPEEEEDSPSQSVFTYFPFMKARLEEEKINEDDADVDILCVGELMTRAKNTHQDMLQMHEEETKEEEEETKEEEKTNQDDQDQENQEEEKEPQQQEQKQQAEKEACLKKDTSKLFAKFKSYNNKASIASATSMFSGKGVHRSEQQQQQQLPTLTKEEKEKNKATAKEKKMNVFSYQGKLVNFSFLQKIPLKEVDKVKKMTFSDFKKLKASLLTK